MKWAIRNVPHTSVVQHIVLTLITILQTPTAYIKIPTAASSIPQHLTTTTTTTARMSPKPSSKPLPPLAPLPRIPHPSPKNLPNPGNTCYINSLLISLFADSDSHDALLHSQHPLTPTLRTIATSLRTGRTVPRETITKLRDTLVEHGWHSGRGQQDVAELLAHLLDLLSAPYIPLVKRLVHSSIPDESDTAPFTERVLWLDPPATSPVALKDMLDSYFFDEVLHGLRRGGEKVTARVTRALFPFYTPLRETGEIVSATRSSFDSLVLPLAINRFKASVYKNRSRVTLPTAIPAGSYIQPIRNAPTYTLILRSVICHLGTSITSGHYVTYTYHPSVGWRRWDDLSERSVPSVRGSVRSGMPEDSIWEDEIKKDCYLVFYELVPGDGEERWQREDESVARHLQIEEDYRIAFSESIKGVFDLSPVSVRGG